jgi:integrase
MKAAPLTALAVKNLSAPGYVKDGACTGLYLQVSPSGTKSWVYRFRWADRMREMGLGAHPPVSLAEARTKAENARKLVIDGTDPIESNRNLKASKKAKPTARPTFKKIAADLIRMKSAEWSNEKHASQWEATLSSYAYTVFGDVPVDQIDRELIMQCLTQPLRNRAGKLVEGQTLWTDRTETATRLRQRIENVLDFGKVLGHRTGDNPAAWSGNLEALLAKPAKLKKVEHHAAVAYKDVPAFMINLAKVGGAAARALELVIYTACRTSEVLLAEWSEFDLDGGTWTVPAGRMKARKEHRVALSAQAVALLRGLPVIDGSDLVFNTSKPGKPLSNMSMLAVLRRMNVPATTHGFRAAFKTWASEETSFPREVIEAALAHSIGNVVEQSYNRGDALVKRTKLMQSWADYVVPLTAGNVVQMPSRSA